MEVVGAAEVEVERGGEEDDGGEEQEGEEARPARPSAHPLGALPLHRREPLTVPPQPLLLRQRHLVSSLQLLKIRFYSTEDNDEENIRREVLAS